MERVQHSVAVLAGDELGPSHIEVFQPIPEADLRELVAVIDRRLARGCSFRIEASSKSKDTDELLKRVAALWIPLSFDRSRPPVAFYSVDHAKPRYAFGRLVGYEPGPISYYLGPPRAEARRA